MTADISQLLSAYKIPYDVRVPLSKIDTGDNDIIWKELWENLYHQGDIGEASLYAVVKLSEIIITKKMIDWNPIALIVSIELARKNNQLEPLPKWILKDYQGAGTNLVRYVTERLNYEAGSEYLRSALALLAIHGNNHDLARLIIEVSPGDESRLLDRYLNDA